MTLTEAIDRYVYDAESGTIYHRNGSRAGKSAGTLRKNGYVQIGAFGKVELAHRIAWLIHYGKYPDGVIDHINGIKNDNRICNLRDVSQFENLQNRFKVGHNNKTGLLGVLVDRTGFQSRITVNGKRIYLGWFSSAIDAHRAYMSAKKLMHSAPLIVEAA